MKKETTKKSTTTKVPRKTTKKDLADLDQVDGKVRGGSARSLDEVMGFVRPSPYGTRIKEEFVAKLRDLNLSDLQAFAQKIGVTPDYDRGRMIDSLVKSFCSYEDIKESSLQKTTAKNDINSLSPEARQLLKDAS